MALEDNASCLLSSQALFIGTRFVSIYKDRDSANGPIAGIYTEEGPARTAILELLETCRERTGWPVKPLGVELQQIWEKQGSS